MRGTEYFLTAGVTKPRSPTTNCVWTMTCTSNAKTSLSPSHSHSRAQRPPNVDSTGLRRSPGPPHHGHSQRTRRSPLGRKSTTRCSQLARTVLQQTVKGSSSPPTRLVPTPRNSDTRIQRRRPPQSPHESRVRSSTVLSTTASSTTTPTGRSTPTASRFSSPSTLRPVKEPESFTRLPPTVKTTKSLRARTASG
ncbi:unannotated protein [freshwater metagenome]|uniref:Unannotated protein n=1 Tax=freshwater metagenome TaxID=449393 RepID=A0A6J6GAM2_9ZZZZ